MAREFTLLCRKLDLFGRELLASDGSKFRAVNRRDQDFTASKLQELLAYTEARPVEYFAALDGADATEPVSQFDSCFGREGFFAATPVRPWWVACVAAHKEHLMRNPQ